MRRKLIAETTRARRAIARSPHRAHPSRACAALFQLVADRLEAQWGLFGECGDLGIAVDPLLCRGRHLVAQHLFGQLDLEARRQAEIDDADDRQFESPTEQEAHVNPSKNGAEDSFTCSEKTASDRINCCESSLRLAPRTKRAHDRPDRAPRGSCWAARSA